MSNESAAMKTAHEIFMTVGVPIVRPTVQGRWMEGFRGFNEHDIAEIQRDASASTTIVLRGFTTITPEQATEAMDEALRIIEKVGTVGINYAYPEAGKWLEKYYPSFV